MRDGAGVARHAFIRLQLEKSSDSPRLRLRVSATAETMLRGGHPWLFADSIREQNRDGRSGELAVIYDRKDEFLAIGLFDPGSPLRVRVLHRGRRVTLDAAWWRENLLRAIRRREGLFDHQTNGYRCINGESDNWPGLVLDRYAGTLVLKLYTAAWLPRLADITALIRDTLEPARLVLRLSRNIQEPARNHFQLEDGSELSRETGDDGKAPSFASRAVAPVEFLETGIRFEADVARGQKTGFFLDQRENRRRVEALASGGKVLNAFSFSGAFSLYAARGGAGSVTDLDISARSLESARRNFALNQSIAGIQACRHETIQTDVFTWLEQCRPGQFDLVILDPPSLARREAERAGAIQAYGKLAANGVRALRPGGVLVAASCSSHVSEAEFFDAVRRMARKSGRAFTPLDSTQHAADHPATFPEARYLKCIYLRG